MIDLYTVMTYHFADAMSEVDRVAEDEGLKQSLRRYAIESGAIMERVYRIEVNHLSEECGKQLLVRFSLYHRRNRIKIFFDMFLHIPCT